MINVALVYTALGVDAVAPGVTVPDLLGVVSAAQLLQVFSELGEGGRDAYLSLAVVDLIYPMAYGALMLLSIAWGWREKMDARPAMKWVLVLPPAGVLADYIENLSFLTLNSQWPDPSQSMAWIAVVGHAIKWGFVLPSALLAVMAFWAGFSRNRRA